MGTKHPGYDLWAWIPNRLPNQCWIYSGAKNQKGYGQFRAAPFTRMLAHRQAWLLTHGPIPPGMFVCHHCDTPACCNPDHLFLGTYKTNMEDCARKGRVKSPFTAQRTITHCPYGHAYTPDNTLFDPKRKIRSCRTCTRQRQREYLRRRRAASRVAS